MHKKDTTRLKPVMKKITHMTQNTAYMRLNWTRIAEYSLEDTQSKGDIKLWQIQKMTL